MIVIKVPGLNSFGKNDGCRNAGNSIIAGLDDIWASEKGKPIDRKLLDLEEIHVDNKNIEEQEKLIYDNSLEEFEKQNKIIFLGGDHSISYPIGKAFLKNCIRKREQPCLIVFDAHPDCMKPMQNPTHEEWLRALVESGFPSQNILLVGVRNSDRKEIEFLAENNIKQISINEINANIEETTDTIMEFSSGNSLYVSFDIDAVDPVFAPSTGYSEPGGLTSRQAIYIMTRIGMMKNLKAFDIVEVDSENDKTGLTVKLASKILGELL